MNPHNDSLESTPSSLTSCSSEASVEFYENNLKSDIDILKNSPIALQELVAEAEKVITETFAPDSRRIYEYKWNSVELSVNLDALMSSMLSHAEECGGENGKRYVASAIVACSKKEDVIEALEALGITWLTHLLFIFKTSHGHENQPHKAPSEIATPTIDTTRTHLMDGIGPRQSTFRDDLMARDGYRCIVTGFQDVLHPKADPAKPEVTLEAAHILRRAIGHFDKDHRSDSHRSAVTTFDILVNFTHLPIESLEKLHDYLGDTSNGMMLQHDAHHGFDNFFWCLKKTEKEHVYIVKVFEHPGVILRMPPDNRVTFEDHSNDFQSSSSKKRKRPIHLPDPQYIAIHAAIAGILHMSGAGKFFDDLLGTYKDDEGKVPAVRSWPELETLMMSKFLRDSLSQALERTSVH